MIELTHFFLLKEMNRFPDILNLVDSQPPSACMTNLLS